MDGQEVVGRLNARALLTSTERRTDVRGTEYALALDATLVTGNLGHMIRLPGLRVEEWSR
jgi:hypothetical protein